VANNYVTDGDSLQWTNSGGSTVAAGTVVAIGNILGVVQADIEASATGTVAIEGVYTVPKVSGAVIAQGESLVWDVSANSNAGAFDDNAATPATGDISGPPALAYEAAGAGVTSFRVKFTGVPGTKT
jgi:predicted RecA/RadA family phage recombinase